MIEWRCLSRNDPASEYLRTYAEWRMRYGLQDPCMDELVAAIRAESEQRHASAGDRDRLRQLAFLIEGEVQAAMERAA